MTNNPGGRHVLERAASWLFLIEMFAGLETGLSAAFYPMKNIVSKFRPIEILDF